MFHICSNNIIYICNMKTQLIQLMQFLNLTAARFADRIGVQRSSISHIISGRNQPSYDFILKILDTFEEVNAEWLLTGKGNMFVKTMAEEGNIVTDQNKKYIERVGEISGKEGADIAKAQELDENQESDNQFLANKVTNVNIAKAYGKVNKIIILYDNMTFDEYEPRKEA